MSSPTINTDNKDNNSYLFPLKNYSPMIIAIAFFVINLFVNLLLMAWFSDLSQLYVMNNIPLFINDWILKPLLLIYFVWIRGAIDRLFRDLTHMGIFNKPDYPYSYLIDLRKRFYHQWIYGGLFILSLIAAVLHSYSTLLHDNSWITAHPAIVWIRLPLHLGIVYAMVLLVYELAIYCITLNKAFLNQRIRIEPLHPDGVGGLGEIGRFSAKLGGGFTIVGFIISLNIMRQSPISFYDSSDIVLMTAIGIYLVVAILVLCLPLWSVSQAMRTYRTQLLKEISVEFDEAFSALQDTRSRNAEETKNLFDRIQKLEEIRTFIKQFPVSPINTENFTKFAGLVLTPLVPGVTSIVTSWINKSILAL